MTDQPRTEQPCIVCGRKTTPYSTCDLCWEGILRETADRHAKAIARREEDYGGWTWNDG